MSLPGIVPAEVDAFLAAREQNWHTDIDLPLPVLSGVGARLAGEEGTVYTISARPAGGSGFFLREAVVWTPPDGERPYWILDWPRGALPLSPDGEEELELPE